jgi:hypothetical protein
MNSDAFSFRSPFLRVSVLSPGPLLFATQGWTAAPSELPELP